MRYVDLFTSASSYSRRIPLFDQEFRLKKRAVRRLERITSSCQTPESASAWMKERRIYRSLLPSTSLAEGKGAD